MNEIVFMSWNRREFTRFALACLLRNTDWDLIDRFVVYDDASSDGIRDELDGLLSVFPVETMLRSEKFRSPPATMNHHIGNTDADVLIKIDSDIAVPAGWARDLLGVFSRFSELELLGMEGGRTGIPRHEPAEYGYLLCTHIGGVGAMRLKSFRKLPRIPAQGRFGFTQWQQDFGLVRGWIIPDLLVCQLDKVPAEPWMGLSERYIREGWQRQWGLYDPKFPYWWEWFDESVVEWALGTEPLK